MHKYIYILGSWVSLLACNNVHYIVSPMGNRQISDDLKEASLHMKARGYPTAEVLTITQFSRSTLQQAKKHKHFMGSVAKAQAIGRGQPRILQHHDSQYLLALARHKPTLFLDEYAQRLKNSCLIRVSMTTIHRTLI